MSIIRGRRPDQGWTPVANEALRDTWLSWSDKGLLAFLLSLQEGERTDVETLSTVGTGGRAATRTSLRNLQAAGYVRRIRYRRPNGTFGTDTYVFDTRAAAREAIEAMGGEDVSAGQGQGRKSHSVNGSDDKAAGRGQGRFPTGGSPEGGSPQGGSLQGKELKDLVKDQTTTASPALGSVGALLAQALVGGLPAQLARRTSASALVARCSELAAAGWTAETLTAWARDQDWGGARSGALVSDRVRYLGPPQTAKPAPLGCDCCIGGWLPDEHDLPGTFPCPTCRPETAARLKEAQ